MFSVLLSKQRFNEIPEANDIYAFLLGAWDVDVSDRLPDGTWRESRGEWHFARVLEGRAIQDVFIVPRLVERADMGERYRNTYGTSIRVYDRTTGEWRVTWINPPTGARNDLVGRREGERIVQEGTGPDGRRIRWIFSEIAPDSCRWTGEVETEAGWRLDVEFRLRRRPG